MRINPPSLKLEFRLENMALGEVFLLNTTHLKEKKSTFYMRVTSLSNVSPTDCNVVDLSTGVINSWHKTTSITPCPEAVLSFEEDCK